MCSPMCYSATHYYKSLLIIYYATALASVELHNTESAYAIVNINSILHYT